MILSKERLGLNAHGVGYEPLRGLFILFNGEVPRSRIIVLMSAGV